MNQKGSGWVKLDPSLSIYHDNGIGAPEEKYIHSDGREAVFDGDTLLPMTDPRYIATYNYCPQHQIPNTGATLVDYVKLVTTSIGHFLQIWFRTIIFGNTREEFEESVKHIFEG